MRQNRQRKRFLQLRPLEFTGANRFGRLVLWTYRYDDSWWESWWDFYLIHDNVRSLQVWFNLFPGGKLTGVTWKKETQSCNTQKRRCFPVESFRGKARLRTSRLEVALVWSFATQRVSTRDFFWLNWNLNLNQQKFAFNFVKAVFGLLIQRGCFVVYHQKKGKKPASN